MFTKRIMVPKTHTYQYGPHFQNYRIIGKGSPLILLHGAMVSVHWGDFEREIAKKHQVFIPDLPGFGASDSIKGKAHNTDLFASSFSTFLQQTNNLKTPIIAFSLGTIVALKTALNGVTKAPLILIGVPGKVFGWKSSCINYLPRSVRRLVLKTTWGKRKLLIPLLRKSIGGEIGQDNKLYQDILTTDPLSIADVNYKQEIERELPKLITKTNNPVLFIYGEHDPQRNTVSHIQKYVTIPQASHNPLRTHPKETIYSVERFLKRQNWK